MTCGFLIFDDVEELDFVGPWEIFAMWAKLADGPRCVTVGETDAALTCSKGLRVIPEHAFADCPALDYLLVPGGWGTRTQVDNPALVDFIRRRAADCSQVLSVCTGAFLLHAAGLLSGRRATTHWRSLERLRGLGDVEVREQRWVRDDWIWTAAGISAGMDMALAFIADQAGPQVAGQVQLATEYYPAGTRYGDAHHALGLPAYIDDRGESEQEDESGDL